MVSKSGPNLNSVKSVNPSKETDTAPELPVPLIAATIDIARSLPHTQAKHGT